jgi:hypothetical protein
MRFGQVFEDEPQRRFSCAQRGKNAQQTARDGRNQADMHRLCLLGEGARHVVERTACIVQQAFGERQHAGAGLGQGQSMSGAGEQWAAEQVLDLTNRGGQRRLGKRERPGGLRKAARVREDHEVLNLLER